MNKQERIDRLLETTKGMEMPAADDFFYTRLSTKLVSNPTQSIRSRLLIGAGVLAVNSLVLLFVFSDTYSTDQNYSRDQATQQLAETYLDHVNFGLNESK